MHDDGNVLDSNLKWPWASSHPHATLSSISNFILFSFVTWSSSALIHPIQERCAFSICSDYRSRSKTAIAFSHVPPYTRFALWMCKYIRLVRPAYLCTTMYITIFYTLSSIFLPSSTQRPHFPSRPCRCIHEASTASYSDARSDS